MIVNDNKIIDITDNDNFVYYMTNDKKHLQVVDFYSDFCEPCKFISPYFENFSKKYTDVKFYKVNASNPSFTELLHLLSIEVVPVFLFFYEGKYIKRIQSTQPDIIEQNIVDLNNKLNYINEKKSHEVLREY